MVVVKIELLRIQTFLFSSYRLRAMLGANSLLGQVIRHDLVRLAQEYGAQADGKLLEKLPSASGEDPLSRAEDPLLRDDPQYLYREYGVVSRDGGHLQATFPQQKQAGAFVEAAMARISDKLPGLLVQAWIDSEPVETPSVAALLGHGAWQICQRTGREPAADRDQAPDGQTPVWVSRMQHDLEKAGGRFRDNPKDLIGILTQKGAIPWPRKERVSLEEVAQRGYLAVIHADGNSIGARFKHYMDGHCHESDPLVREACAERFFHSMRVAVRCALTQTLGEQFGKAPERYQLLMLGGDDLLLVCNAADALPFVTAYERALARYPLADGRPLSIGVGVVIAKKKFPFYRLHALAEELADSAKRYFRALGNESLSVIDWLVTSQSWEDSALAIRRAHYAGEKLCACLKPYPIRDETRQSAHGQDLTQLMKLAERLSLQALARSQLKRLQGILQGGDKDEVALSWRELPQTLRDQLEKSGLENWYQSRVDNVYLSVLDDLIELMEIAHLGQEKKA